MSRKKKFILRQCILFIVNCAFLAAIVWLVHRYAFCVVRATSDELSPAVVKGERLLVNKLQRDDIHKGDLLVFGTDSAYIGVVINVPGDTVRTDSTAFLLPIRCCDRCKSSNCQPYLVQMGQAVTLVYHADVIGQAYSLSLFKP
ncbi:MAG: S26 family signal peptidase [Prevotella sp.]|nr:S26 family signal peptidase [Prevotella sp.]